MNRIGFLAVLLLSLLSAVSCVERRLELRPQPTPLVLHMIWPDGQVVEGSRVLMYDSDGHLYLDEEAPARKFVKEVLPDNYTVLVTNTDYQNTAIQNPESWNRCSMFANVLDSTKMQYAFVRNVFTCGAHDVVVDPFSKSGNEYVLYPKNRVKLIKLTVKKHYVDDVQGMNISMDGVVPSIRVYDGMDLKDSTVIVKAPAKRVISQASLSNPEDPRQMEHNVGEYYVEFTVYGWRGTNMVNIKIEYDDGRVEHVPPVDITDIMNNLDGNLEIDIEVDVDIELEDGGFITLVISVRDWDTSQGSGTVM